jgi:SMC interacting uncharacterized protein involved in chromosome segregation
MATENDIKALEKIVEKLDSSIEKLTEVNNNIGKLLAVHEQRMNNIEKDAVRNESDIRDIHDKINLFSIELRNHIDSVEHNLELKLKENADNSTYQHNNINEAIIDKLKTFDYRLTVLEAWRWLVIGGAAVVGYLISIFVQK